MPKNTTLADYQQKTDTLGIVSIVFAFTGLQLIGLVVGVVGERNAKREGRPYNLSRIGWIINLVIVVIAIVSISIFVALIPYHHKQVADAGKRADLNYFKAHLETFYNQNGYYPNSIDQFTVSTIDTTASDGTPYQYTVRPNGCQKCTSYTLSAKLDLPQNGSSIYLLKSAH